jgi:hypothetical protein
MKFLTQNYMKYNLLMCVILIAGLTRIQLSGSNQGFFDSSAVFWFSIGIPAIVWFLGIWSKKRELKNKMTFKQGFMEGWKITLAFAIISPFIFLIYYTLFNPSIVTIMRHGSSDPTWLVIGRDNLLQFVATIVIGAPTAAILAFFLKSKKK